jgi:hypothetical protein
MNKRNKIIYWIATIWLSLGMFSTGLVQILHIKEEVALTENLGYPAYLLTIIGIWKMLGVIAVLVPGFPLLKEWAYAGFFFVMTGAVFSHLAAGQATDVFPSLLLLALTVTSWYFRPAERRLVAVSQS